MAGIGPPVNPSEIECVYIIQDTHGSTHFLAVMAPACLVFVYGPSGLSASSLTTGFWRSVRCGCVKLVNTGHTLEACCGGAGVSLLNTRALMLPHWVVFPAGDTEAESQNEAICTAFHCPVTNSLSLHLLKYKVASSRCPFSFLS